ncbi:alpha-amylase family glycosyl hydrolase [Williamwhitmania taraxaci]|uniref:Por secretion system C-terminal sorting domain-containing protein n=1 Tax=Williamwhitmania taraxaci TaxID=1640674 RepID=A0A1G6HT85_9BACT|nr:alpha-amylase family glycosyl hydrolase [Williamwhitmania taraxaci]SDB97499.1 Por secretion system C-terminal sorting domain-containing protein [Williamwhitmania taraxaci]
MKTILTKVIAITVFLFWMSSTLLSQVITVTPTLPTATDQVVVTFDATLGNAALKDFAGDIYAHTGVNVDGIEQWAYVIGAWGVNTAQPKLTRSGSNPNLYTLTISPSIREFYKVPAEKKITKLCFVFRSADGSKQTSPDILYNVYEPGLSLTLSNPLKDQPIYELNSAVAIEASANNSTSLSIFIDNIQVNTTTNATISYSYPASAYGNHWIKAVASDATSTLADSVNIIVRPAVITEELPAGVKPGINYIDNTTVTLVLKDPAAKKSYAFAFGDFSDWLIKADYYMKRTSDGKYYWITLSGLDPNKEYGFQYNVDGNITIADPYSEKLLDPWSDQYIVDSTYSGLKQYPVGKTTGIVSIFKTGQQPYPWQVTNFSNPDKSKLIIYELLVRDFTHAHSYARVADSIAYFKRLGVNVIELMPINEFDGNLSWGYNPSFYFAPDKYYGPANELKRLVDVAHQNGIAVVLDLVLNHSYGQSPFLKLYFDKNTNKPTVDNPWYNVQSNFTNPDAQWGYDFNHESIETQALVDSISRFWMSEYKVDGFRFDFTKGFSNTPHTSSDPWGGQYDAARITILERMANKIWEYKSDAYVIAEHLSDNAEETVLANHGLMLWGNLNGSYLDAGMGFIPNSNFSGISYKSRGWNNPNLIGYMESHDEERSMYKNLTSGNSDGAYSVKNLKTALNRSKLTSLFLIPVPGPKMIWQFGEVGYDFSIDLNGRTGEKPIRWDYMNNADRSLLFSHYATLNKLKREYAPFSGTDFTTSFSGVIKTMRLTSGAETAVIIGNFDVKSMVTTVSFPTTGKWYEFFSQDSVTITSTDLNLTLGAGAYRMFTNTRLIQKDTYTSTPIIQADNSGVWLNVYPNPSNGSSINILAGSKVPTEAEVSVYSLSGQKLATLFTGTIIDQELIQVQNNYRAGIYIISVKTKTTTLSQKLVIF